MLGRELKKRGAEGPPIKKKNKDKGTMLAWGVPAERPLVKGQIQGFPFYTLGKDKLSKTSGIPLLH